MLWFGFWSYEKTVYSIDLVQSGRWLVRIMLHDQMSATYPYHETQLQLMVRIQ